MFPDDPFAHIDPMHKRTSRKAKHGHGTRTFSRSLGGDFEVEEYYAPRRTYKANTGRTGHVEQRTMQEDPYILGGKFSFPMKEDLERREVVGVSSTSPFMTTYVSTISQGGAPLQRSHVRERMGECVESDVQPFGQNTWIPSPQPMCANSSLCAYILVEHSDACKCSSISWCCNFRGFCDSYINWKYATPGLNFIRGASFTNNSVKYVYRSC
jgi:hypothetical protein